MEAQAAQTVIDSGDLKPIDRESTLEDSVTKLSNTLGEVVKVILGKMDDLAEVWFYLERAIVLFPDRFPYNSFIRTRISHGRRVHLCIG